MRTILVVIAILTVIANWDIIKDHLVPQGLSLSSAVNQYFDSNSNSNSNSSIDIVDSQSGGSDVYQEPSGFTNNWLNSRHNDKLFSVHYPDYKLYQQDSEEDTNYKTILGTIQERSTLNDAFFGRNNMNHLKNLIADQVYKKSGYSISAHAQSDNELLIIMRAIFLQYARHLPDDVKGQVAELNLKILLDVVPRIISKVKMELTYQRDHGSQPLPIQLPVNVSNAGTKTGRSFDSFII